MIRFGHTHICSNADKGDRLRELQTQHRKASIKCSCLWNRSLKLIPIIRSISPNLARAIMFQYCLKAPSAWWALYQCNICQGYFPTFIWCKVEDDVFSTRCRAVRNLRENNIISKVKVKLAKSWKINLYLQYLLMVQKSGNHQLIW